MTDSVSYWVIVAGEDSSISRGVTSKYSLRVQRKDNGGWVVHDIKGVHAYESDEIPANIRDRIALLAMMDSNDVIVPDVGYRFSRNVFYLDPDSL